MILEGDCIERMAAMDAASVDAIVTDPPYGLGFMGKQWDALPPGEDVAREMLRVLKPGGHLLAFGGTRTYHRLAVAVEDAGFEIRDQLAWLYGSGFPKSLDVSKAIDKAAGAEREVVGRYQPPNGKAWNLARDESRPGDGGTMGAHSLRSQTLDRTAPATPDAEQWSGWGTALKPAHEPIVVARKPLVGTVAANVLEHGTGALNVDGCRVTYVDQADKREETRGVHVGGAYRHPAGGAFAKAANPVAAAHDSGRWPANVVLDEEAAAMLDAQTGTLTSGDHRADQVRSAPTGNGVTHGAMKPVVGFSHGDSGGASRFFYCAKASRRERNAGLDHFEERHKGADAQGMQNMAIDGHGNNQARVLAARNHHPTVKPLALMRWLVRLVTPPGGTVLDPFAGSGTTGIAAALEGFDFIGIEREPEYAAIARARIDHWSRQQLPLAA